MAGVPLSMFAGVKEQTEYCCRQRRASDRSHLLECGLATAVATDAHQLGDLQQAAAGLAWIDKKLGHAAVVRLFDHAPRAILAGELPD